MFEIKKDKSIVLTRGDSAVFRFRTNQNIASAALTVKKKIGDVNPIVSWNLNGDLFVINPQDTIEIPEGNYVYDIEMETNEGLVVSTPLKHFTLKRGVTND